MRIKLWVYSYRLVKKCFLKICEKHQIVISSLFFNWFSSSFHCFVRNLYSLFCYEVKPVPDFPFKRALDPSRTIRDFAFRAPKFAPPLFDNRIYPGSSAPGLCYWLILFIVIITSVIFMPICVWVCMLVYPGTWGKTPKRATTWF